MIVTRWGIEVPETLDFPDKPTLKDLISDGTVEFHATNESIQEKP